MVAREPAGVVGTVAPWNFPLTLAGWKVAPALAAGCTVVLKPSESSPLPALLLGRIGTEAGLPPGALNVVTGDGPIAYRAIGLHPDIDVLAFTGSTGVGRHYLRYAADSNLKRVWLELGGESPNIILPDAADPGEGRHCCLGHLLQPGGDVHRPLPAARTLLDRRAGHRRRRPAGTGTARR